MIEDSENQSVTRYFTLIILIFILFSNYLILESIAEMSVKKSDEIRCKNFYSKFIAMGEDNLRKRYPAYPIMEVCLKMYHSHSFKFQDKELVDKILPSELNNKILSKQKIGPDKFLVKFNICSKINENGKYVQITTDKEQVSGKIPHSFNGKCTSFWAQISANIVENTQLSLSDENTSNSKIRKLIG